MRLDLAARPARGRRRTPTYSSRSRTGGSNRSGLAGNLGAGGRSMPPATVSPDVRGNRSPASPSPASPTATPTRSTGRCGGTPRRERGSFWTWREQMYAVAAELTPDTYFELARDTYAEMRATGITAVGEFHYLHHQPDGTPYDDPNEMGRALLAAADEAGIRIRLLDTCYLAAGFGRPPEGVQVRYSDGDAERGPSGSPPSTTRASGWPSTRCVPCRATSCRSWSRRRRASRCTCTCPSRSRRTRPASTRPG